MAHLNKSEWTSWALENLKYGLVVRVTLDRLPNGRPGSEELHAAVMARFADDDGPVLGLFEYQDLRGVGKTIELHTSTEQDNWRLFVEQFIERWTDVWLSTEVAVCMLTARSWSEEGNLTSDLPLASTLALQHFARLEGIVTGVYRSRNDGNEGAILHAMEHRLNTLIVIANDQREKTLAFL